MKALPVPGSGLCDWVKDFADGPEMVVVPRGHFVMGSPVTQAGRCHDGREAPQITLIVERPFAIGRFAITVSQFAVFSKMTGYRQTGGIVLGAGDDWWLDPEKSFLEPGFEQTDRHPAVGINWDDAAAYVAWLSDQTGRDYRLPTEAEWEYAARAGTSSAFWWGDTIAPELANYDARHSLAGSRTGHTRKGTVSVEHYFPNSWGLYQVHGNVWEWCDDDYLGSLSDLPRDGTRRTRSNCSLKTLRGGSWLNGPWNLRSASRLGDPHDFRHTSFGFRVACMI